MSENHNADPTCPARALEFCYVAWVEGLHFEPVRPGGLEFQTPDGATRFRLVPRKPDLDSSGHRIGLECKVYCTFPSSTDQIEFVRAYVAGKFVWHGPGQPSLPRLSPSGDKELVSSDGSFADGYRPALHVCPSDILPLVLQVESEMAALAERFLRLIRWRQNVDGPNEVISSGALYWRVGMGEYHATPPRRQEQTGPAMSGIHWEPDRIQELADLWSGGFSEPLGHELLREAGEVANGSPRSALLIAVAAIETGLKSHVSRLAPDAAWLMEKTQSPPTSRMLRDYVPSLHEARGVDMTFWEAAKSRIKEVERMAEVRNTVAHTGTIPSEARPIAEYLELARDVLYLLDVLDGHDWARQRVSHGLRSKLGWPEPPERRLRVTMVVAYD